MTVAGLPSPLLDRLAQAGFDPARLEAWARSMGGDREARNRLTGSVVAPRGDDVARLPEAGSPEHEALAAVGTEALRRGDVAFCVLAGGMATRMGGVVKALVDALPGRSFLDLRLAENRHIASRFGARMPFWLMTSSPTDSPIRDALGTEQDGNFLATFQQFASLRLTPDGSLFLDDQGAASMYSTGHGDLPDALRRSGLLARFIARGGRTVWIANIDNLGATIDPAILGFHLTHGQPVTVELVERLAGDRGGGPVRWNGRPIITEEFRLPVGFDPLSVTVFNTNTFLVDAMALNTLAFEFTYVEVEKQIGGARAVQFERIFGEITSALDSRFLRVPRAGATSRFLPVKDVGELDRRRAEIEFIARLRGMIDGG